MADQGGSGEVQVRRQHLPHGAEESAPGWPEDVGRRAPVFFLSYAHPRPSRRSAKFAQFFDDLSENVAQLISRPAGQDPGFMDRSVDGGTRWTGELLEALGTFHVFIALLSVPYLCSNWCGMEWSAFTQRTVTGNVGNESPHQSAIIPVIWAPLRSEQIPGAVLAVQRFSPTRLPNPSIAAQYEEHGIYGLLTMQQDSAYQTVVWNLAQQVANIHYNYRVEPRHLVPGELHNLFREQ